MSVRAIEAEVSIKSGVQAKCTIGREVIRTVYVDPVLESLSVTENGTYEPSEGIDGYDRVVVDIPIITPDISPLTVTANGTYTAEGDGFNPVTVNVEAPKDPNIVEGEFIGTEEGILQVDIPYNGDTFPKMIIVYVKDEIASLNGNFIANANIYGINVCQLLKTYSTTPSYNGSSNNNFARMVLLYKGSNSGYNQSAVGGYNYNQGTCRWNADCLKIRNNKTMDVFIKTDRDPETGGIYFMQGIRYKYQVFY